MINMIPTTSAARYSDKHSSPGSINGRHEPGQFGHRHGPVGSQNGIQFALEDPEGVDHRSRLVEYGSRKWKLLEVLIQGKQVDQIPGLGTDERKRALMEDQPVKTPTDPCRGSRRESSDRGGHRNFVALGFLGRIGICRSPGVGFRCSTRGLRLGVFSCGDPGFGFGNLLPGRSDHGLVAIVGLFQCWAIRRSSFRISSTRSSGPLR